MNPTPTFIPLLERPISWCPSIYTNEYFDVMEAPLSCWPKVTEVQIEPGAQVIQIPTAEIWVAGDWLARRYAATPFSKIQAWLRAHNIFHTSLTILNSPRIESEKKRQDRPATVTPPPMDEPSDAPPGL